MLMTDQVHLAAQLGAEFTLVPRSFSLSLYSLLSFLPTRPPRFSLPSHLDTTFPTVCVCVCVCVRERERVR